MHEKDTDCTVGPDDCCTGCGVYHGDPCEACGGAGFHREGCPESDATAEILTDGEGRPIPRPEPPSKNASTEERIAYLRAIHAYNDRVADVANRGFARGLRGGL